MSSVWKPDRPVDVLLTGELGPVAWQRGPTPPPGSWPKMSVSPSHVNAAEWPVGLSTFGSAPAISGTTRL